MPIRSNKNGIRSWYRVIRRSTLFIAGAVLTASFAGTIVHAAPLSYAHDTNIYLSSSGITLTIASGSSADNLVVNATSAAVTLSNITGGDFTLTSSASDLSIATSSTGGTVALSCTSGVASATISQNTGSTIYTITPTGSPCTATNTATSTPSAPVLSGGGGSMYHLSINSGTSETATTSVILSLYGTGAYTMEISNTSTFADASWIPYTTVMPWTLVPGLGSATVYARFKSVGGTIVGTAQASIDLIPATSSLAESPSFQSSSSTPSVASSPSSASLFDRLKALQAELAALLAQANQSTPSSTRFTFTRNLTFGITDNDVKELQRFLISQNAGPAARKLAAHGMTRNFASLTRAALIEFQKHANIKPASGYFGPITRQYANSLF